MAFQIDGNQRSLMSDINVVPLVDVMLVLLIIFMVTAPMMMQGMDVELPEVDAQAMRTEGEQVVITMTADGEIFLDEFKVSVEDLGLKVKRIMEVKGAKQVYLRADKNIPYGQVARVMGEIREAGVTALGLVTEPEPVTELKKP